MDNMTFEEIAQTSVWLNQTHTTVTQTDPFLEMKLITQRMSAYCLPVLIVIGLIGNGLSVLVFLRTYLRRISISVYMATLAVSDSTFLITLFVIWLEYVDVRAFHKEGICQLTIYLSYCSGFLSVWCVVSFSVERYIAISYPLLRPELCTSERAKRVVICLGVLSLIIYSPCLYSSGITLVKNQYRMCTPLKEHARTVTVLLYMDTMLTFILPFFSILILNSVIIYRIATFYRSRRRCQNKPEIRLNLIASSGQNTRPATSSSDSNRATTPSDSTVTSSEAKHSVATSGGNASILTLNSQTAAIMCETRHLQANLGLRAQIKITKSMLLISSVYLVINLPSYLIRMKIFITDIFRLRYDGSADDFVIQQLSQFLYYINFSVNFFLYSLCSAKFRDACKRFWYQVKYNVTRYVERSYRLFRKNSSTYDTDLNEIPCPAYVPQEKLGIKIKL